MTGFFKRFASDTEGATAVEYGVIVALVFLGMIAGVTAFGGAAIDMWNDSAESVQNAS